MVKHSVIDLEQLMAQHNTRWEEIEKEYKDANVEIDISSEIAHRKDVLNAFLKATKRSNEPKQYSIGCAQRCKKGDKEYLVLQITTKQVDVQGNRVHYFDTYGRVTKPYFNTSYEGDERKPVSTVDETEDEYIFEFSKELWDSVKQHMGAKRQFVVKSQSGIAVGVDDEEEWLHEKFSRLEKMGRTGQTTVVDGNLTAPQTEGSGL